MSLMKNFFLQIVNKSQGEIIKYKQAYETQRERRKEIEAKLTQTADEMQREAKVKYSEMDVMNKRANDREQEFQIQLKQQQSQIRRLEEQIKAMQQHQLKQESVSDLVQQKRAHSQCETKNTKSQTQMIASTTLNNQRSSEQFKTQQSNQKKAPVPFLDLTKVVPNFSLKKQ